jgi:hypothetical protein
LLGGLAGFAPGIAVLVAALSGILEPVGVLFGVGLFSGLGLAAPNSALGHNGYNHRGLSG